MSQPDFTNATVQALNHARQQSNEHGSVYVGTEHLLLGLLKLENEAVTGLLDKLGVDSVELARATKQVIDDREIEVSKDDLKRFQQMAQMKDKVDTTASSTASLPEVPYSGKARQAMVDTGEVAEVLGVDEIDAVHFLAAIIKDPDTLAAKMLKTHGVNYDVTVAALTKD